MLNTMIMCLSGLILAFFVLLSHPRAELRSFLLQLLGLGRPDAGHAAAVHQAEVVEVEDDEQEPSRGRYRTGS